MRIFGKITKKLRGKCVLDSTIYKNVSISSGCCVYHSVVKSYSYFGYDCIVVNCEIGKFCSIADNVFIGGANHPLHWVSTSPVFLSGKNALRKNFSSHDFYPYSKTVIGNDVWIGFNAIIKSGIVVGDGAVIGMGSVVTKNIPPYEIWAGNPARKIKDRFPPAIKERLIKSEWWNFDDRKLKEYAKLFDDPIAFLDKVDKTTDYNE